MIVFSPLLPIPFFSSTAHQYNNIAQYTCALLCLNPHIHNNNNVLHLYRPFHNPNVILHGKRESEKAIETH